jgi:hypothetical protein
MSGMAPAFDSSGNLYFSTGNGTFDGNNSSSNFGESLLKLAPRTLSRLDFFTPSNFATLNNGDTDFGSGGPLFLPGTNVIATAGKALSLAKAGPAASKVLDNADLGDIFGLDMAPIAESDTKRKTQKVNRAKAPKAAGAAKKRAPAGAPVAPTALAAKAVKTSASKKAPVPPAEAPSGKPAAAAKSKRKGKVRAVKKSSAKKKA